MRSKEYVYRHMYVTEYSVLTKYVPRAEMSVNQVNRYNVSVDTQSILDDQWCYWPLAGSQVSLI
jgi:hypothetical protein